MGAQNSSLYGVLEEEFNRLVHKGRKRLVLGQILQLRLPNGPWNLDPSHLGVLFVLDRDRRGKVSLADLFALVELAEQRVRCYQLHEFQMQMQGFCTLQMWRFAVAQGEDKLALWLTKLVKNAGRSRRFLIARDDLYIHENSVRLLFQMCRVEEAQGIQFAEYLTILQQTGENEGLMDIEDVEQDEWVPLSIAEIMLKAIAEGICKVMQEVYPQETLA